MSRVVWIGTRGTLLQIKAPQPGSEATPMGYSESAQYLNGRKAVRTSRGSHMEYNYTWRGTRDELAPLTDLAGGVYGSGPFYMFDPVWAGRNILPRHWSAPHLGADEAPQVYGRLRPTRTSVTTGALLNIPPLQANFTNQAGSKQREVYVPIPPGHTARFSYVGTAGVLRIQPTLNGVASGGVTTPNVTAVGASAMTEQVIPHSPTVNGLLLRVQPTTSFNLRAMQLRLVRSALTPQPVKWHAGMGHAALDFEGHPTVTPYSVPYDSIGVTARLVEVNDDR